MMLIADLKKIISPIIKINADNLHEDEKIKEKYLVDSIDMLRLLNTIESRLKMKLPLTQFLRVETINNLHELITKAQEDK